MYLVVCSLVVKALLMLIARLALQLAPLVLRPVTHTYGGVTNSLPVSGLDPDSSRSVDPDPVKMTQKSRKNYEISCF